MDRVSIKQKAMDAGECGAEFVDQLCKACCDAGQGRCPCVPERPDSTSRTTAVSALLKFLAAVWAAIKLDKAAATASAMRLEGYTDFEIAQEVSAIADDRHGAEL